MNLRYPLSHLILSYFGPPPDSYREGGKKTRKETGQGAKKLCDLCG
jgi:hypothetical protein